MQSRDYITSVTPLTENGSVIGYTVSFAKSPAIVIYHGKNGTDGTNGSDGSDGTNGKDGHSPIVSVRQDTDGNWYWTLDGEWLEDAQGNRIRANGLDGQDGQDGQNGSNGQDGQDGITPMLKIENGRWMLSLDEGDTWTDIGQATGANGQDGQDGKDGDSMFSSVTVGDDVVTFVLSDGTTISVPKKAPFDIVFSNTDAIRCTPGSTYRISYTIEGADDATEIEALAQDGLKASIERTDRASGAVVVTLPLAIVERSTVVVLLTDGRGNTLMKSLNFVVGTAGGTVEVPLQTNLNYRVEIAGDAASWLHLAPATRAALREETLTFIADANTGAVRRGFVYLIDLADETIAQTLCITQSGDETAYSEIIRFNDPQFQAFLVANYDLDGDGKISKGEALEVIVLNVSKKSISDLTGLEWFTSLISLNVSQNSNLKSLDVSCLTALESLNCSECSIGELDLKKNKALRELSCSGGDRSNILTQLDLSENRALVKLDCSSQRITSLDLSQNTELQEVNCAGSSKYLRSLKVTGCFKLRKLLCNNQLLTSIDLSGCPELTELSIYSNNLLALDLSQNRKLSVLRCYSNKIRSLNLSANPLLKTVDIGYNPLTSLDLGTNFETFSVTVNKYTTVSSLRISAPGLKTLSLQENYSSSSSSYLLQSVDLAGCSDLETLSITGIPATDLDVSMLPKLKSLSVTECKNLSALDLRHNPDLGGLACTNNSSLKYLDITANLNLGRLNVRGTAIESLDLSAYKFLNYLAIWDMPDLRYINLGDNPYITSLTEQTGAFIGSAKMKIVGTRITALNLSNSYNIKLQDLDITECPALETLTLGSTKMTTIDLSGNPKLKSLSCNNSQFQSLDLSANPALETVSCYSCLLLSIDVSRCPKLKTLDCQNNHLQRLDVGNNPELTSLNCKSNDLKTLDISNILELQFHGFAHDVVHGCISNDPIHHLRSQYFVYPRSDADRLSLAANRAYRA